MRSGNHSRTSGRRGAALRGPVLALASALGLALAGGAAAQSAPQAVVLPGDGTLLSVSAQAEAKRVPDIAMVSAGVVTQAAEADAAMRANATSMERVMDAIRKAGIAPRDVQTTGVNIHPQYDYREGSTPAITGYQASNTVSVTVRDIGDLGDVLDALVASGANQVHGPSFDIDDKDSAYDEARRAALVKARARADMYAGALGMRVRRIASISEGGGFGPPQPMPMMAMDVAESRAATPISPGESTLSVNLDVVFELGR
jgi:uncharacterized protein YggE